MPRYTGDYTCCGEDPVHEENFMEHVPMLLVVQIAISTRLLVNYNSWFGAMMLLMKRGLVWGDDAPHEARGTASEGSFHTKNKF